MSSSQSERTARILARTKEQARANDIKEREVSLREKELELRANLPSESGVPSEDRVWLELARAAHGRADVSVDEVLDWVAENQPKPLEQIDCAGVPSVHAVGLLRWAKSEDGEHEFMKRCLDKMLKSKDGPQVEDPRFVDDDREVVGLFNRLQSEIRGGLTENDEAL